MVSDGVCAVAEATATAARIAAVHLMGVFMNVFCPMLYQCLAHAKGRAVSVNRTAVRCQVPFDARLLRGVRMKEEISLRCILSSELWTVVSANSAAYFLVVEIAQRDAPEECFAKDRDPTKNQSPQHGE